MTHVFIGYGKDARPYADLLAVFLRRAGLAVRLDNPDRPLERRIAENTRQIQACSSFVIVMSAGAEDETCVEHAFHVAERSGKQIAPLLVSGASLWFVGDIQFEDVTDGAMPSAQFVERLRSIAAPRTGRRRFLVAGASAAVAGAAALAGLAAWWRPDGSGVGGGVNGADGLHPTAPASGDPTGSPSASATGPQAVPTQPAGSTAPTLRPPGQVRKRPPVRLGFVEPALDLTLTGHTDTVWSIAWSSDDRRIATASGDRTARVWDASDGRTLRTFTHPGYLWSIAWAPDDKRIATASADRTARTWDVATGNTLRVLSGHNGRVSGVDWSPDGRYVATAAFDGEAWIWDAESGTVLRKITDHNTVNYHPVASVAWSPDGTRMATASRDRTARVRDWSGAPLVTLSGHTSYVDRVAWSADGKRLATTSLDDTVRIWEATSSASSLTLSEGTTSVLSVAWCPDGSRVAAGCVDKLFAIWDAVSGERLYTHTADDGGTAVAWSHDGTRLAVVGSDNTVGIWRVANPR